MVQVHKDVAAVDGPDEEQRLRIVNDLSDSSGTDG